MRTIGHQKSRPAQVLLILLLGATWAVGQDPEFTYTAQDVVVSGSPTTIWAEMSAWQHAGDPVPITAFSMAVASDPGLLTPLDVGVTGPLEGLNLGFFGLVLHPDGWAVNVLVHGHGGSMPPLVDPQPLLEASYEVGDPTGGPVTTPLTWGDEVGTPPFVVNTILGFGPCSGGCPIVFENGSVTLSPVDFVRGDCDADGVLGLLDVITILDYLFNDAGPPPCLDACEVNGDGGLELADAIFEANFLFLGGALPPVPFPDCGPGTTGFSCEEFGMCP